MTLNDESFGLRNQAAALISAGVVNIMPIICRINYIIRDCIDVFFVCVHERSYHVNCTRSRPIPEVKLRRVQPVVRCSETIWFSTIIPTVANTTGSTDS